MGALIHIIYVIVERVPGLAVRTHRPCGRMGLALQLVMIFAGVAAAATALAGGRLALRGFEEGYFGYFPASMIAAVAVFLLAAGARAAVHGVRNPAPPARPDNGVAFARPVAAPAARDPLHRYRRWDG
jgi:hypothetical protein